MSTSDATGSTLNTRNRLAREASAYLRQHAKNPVDWYPWGEEAIRRARREDKPIFVSIGYASCHWCHVMEREVFDNEEIAAYLNEHFICIKIDREERPDLDRIYMEAVQLMTRGGGWPLSVWLTPELQPFFGGTYYPPDSFYNLLQRLHFAWDENRDQIDETAEQLQAYISRNPMSANPESFTMYNVKEIGETALKMMDNLYGGFQGGMKFPVPLRWQFLLHLYRATGDKRYSKAVRDALVAMASGGLQDHIGGGFHRYTTDASWTVPHFEKMLYDNAQLASLYLEMAAVCDDKALYSRVAKRTLNFLLNEMYDEELGGFFASFDADSGGAEGSFYVWTPAEIKAVVGPKDAEALCMLFGVTEEGNFDGNRTVLTRRYPYEDVVARTGRPLEELKALVEEHRKPLYYARSRRIPPTLDKKIVTSWNALAVSAMVQGYRYFGDERYLNAAEKTVAFLRKHHWHDRALVRASTEGTTAGDGILDDYAFLANALIDLFQATGNADHVVWADELTGIMQRRFRHESAGFYHTSRNTEAPLGRQVEILDNVEPSGLSMALHVLLRMAALQSDQTYTEQVSTDIEAFAQIIKKAGLDMAGWVDAALLLLNPMYELVIVRPIETTAELPKRSALRQSVDELLPPYVQVIPLEDDLPTPDMMNLLPGIGDKPALDGQITGYVCQFGQCNAPTSSIDQLTQQLLAEWKK